jgi:ribosomal protein L19E
MLSKMHYYYCQLTRSHPRPSHCKAEKKGRHTGPGKRKRKSESENADESYEMKEQRVLWRLLWKYKEAGEIDSS